MLGDVGDREVIGIKAPAQRTEGKQQQQEVGLRRRARKHDPLPPAGLGPHQGQHPLHDGNTECKDEREMSEFRNHGLAAPCAFLV